MSKRISFRGQLADGGVDRIKLTTMKGKKGYRIVKFSLMPDAPGTVEHELVAKIYKTKQDSADGTVDFTDSTLLATSIMTSYAPTAFITATTTVFDNEVFNQDIYVTGIDVETTSKINYYIELEAMDISDLEATQLTLKNLRAVASR